MDRCKLREAGGDVGEQVAQAARAGAENDDGDASRFEILLIDEALVDGEKTSKFAVSAAERSSPLFSPARAA